MSEVIPRCQLLSTTGTYVIQLLLGCITFGTLWLKRHVERPCRTLEIWFMDVSKQGIGAAIAHLINISIAMQMPHLTDECAWYFINFISDCTLGMIINLAFLRLQQEISFAFNLTRIQECGEYGLPPSYKTWIYQLITWVFIILSSKAIVFSVLIAFAIPIGKIGELLFYPISYYPFSELILVMIVCPTFFNIVQCWIQDSFLKHDGNFLLSSYKKYRNPPEELQVKLLQD